MSNTFLIADLHFGQASSLTWLKENGELMRPFESVEHMDETIIHNWNSVVKPIDKVYVLGDIAMKKAYIKQMERCNGKKVLVKGNHDSDKLSVYAQYFYDIRATHKLDHFILSHIPVHPDSLNSRISFNIHGHLHSGNVRIAERHGAILEVKNDPRYFCVSAEQVNFTPIPFETVKKIMLERQHAQN